MTLKIQGETVRTPSDEAGDPRAGGVRPEGRGKRWIGADVPRIDAARYVLGRIDYAADLIPSDALHVAVLRSPREHPRDRHRCGDPRARRRDRNHGCR